MLMGEKCRKIFMQLTALAVLFSIVYPATALSRNILFKKNTGLFELIIALSIGVFGFLTGVLVTRNASLVSNYLEALPFKNKSIKKLLSAQSINSFLVYCTLILPVIFVSLIFLEDGIRSIVFENMVCLVIYITALRISMFYNSDMIDKFRLYLGILLSAVYIAISVYIDQCTQMKTQTIIFSIIFLFTALCLQNQSRLDFMFMKKGQYLRRVPKKIRMYNMISIVIFFAMVMLLLNVNKIILFLLAIVEKGIEFVQRILFQVIEYIWGIAFCGINDGVDNLQNLKEEGRRGVFMLNDASEMLPPVWVWIGSTLKYFILIYSMYKIIPIIVLKIRHYLLDVKGVNTVYNTEEYTDEMKYIDMSEVREKSTKVVKQSLHAQKALEKITDPVERVKYIYRILIGVLVQNGINVNMSDTTGEICKKVSAFEDIELYMRRNSVIYDYVKYGKKIPKKEDMYEYENNFKKFANQLTRIDKPKNSV